ncbi:hypothetical protein Tco_0493675 [Tanacetum coccineum]
MMETTEECDDTRGEIRLNGNHKLENFNEFHMGHILELENGTMIHMLGRTKVSTIPRELIEECLEHKLESSQMKQRML